MNKKFKKYIFISCTSTVEDLVQILRIYALHFKVMLLQLLKPEPLEVKNVNIIVQKVMKSLLRILMTLIKIIISVIEINWINCSIKLKEVIIY